MGKNPLVHVGQTSLPKIFDPCGVVVIFLRGKGQFGVLNPIT